METFEDNKWYKPKMKGFIHECCNCGLQHEVSFKVFYDDKINPVEFKWKRIKVKNNTKEKIKKTEGLFDWKIKISKGVSDGIVLFKTKTIVIGEHANMAMFIHELAHAITEEGHTGKFADKFTALVDKYMIVKQET